MHVCYNYHIRGGNDMIVAVKAITNIEIKSLSDLKRLKFFMDNNGLKINKAQIARNLGKDSRTIGKYLEGYEKPKARKKGSSMDEYYDIIKELLSSETQIFYYRSVLYQYLIDNYKLKIPEMTFRHYLNKHQEFDKYFKKDRISNAKGLPVIRFETGKGNQSQLDWKESIDFVLKDTGEVVKVNVLVLILSYSRLRIYKLSLSKTQDILIHYLTECFEELGGVSKEILTDNMSTIMTDARTLYTEGKINEKFEVFAKDFGFKVRPCMAGAPETKAKVESPMRVLDELRAYSGTLTYVELNDKLSMINSRRNCSINCGTGRIPIQEFEKEKGSLLPLPHESIRNQYKIKTTNVKVNSASMITYKGNQYSVPPEYLSKTVSYQVHDLKLHVYSNTKLIALHNISDKKLNYDVEHYERILSLNFKGKCDDDIKVIAKRNLDLIGEIYGK